MKNTLLYLTLTLCGFLITSCDEEPSNPSFEIPDTYNFENVSYSGQTARISMLNELQAEVKKVASENKSLDMQQLLAMYTNDPTAANWQGTYDESKQIKSKTFPAYQELFTNILVDAAEKSQDIKPAENGQAGVISNSAGDKSYYVNENGLEYAQFVAKGLMGALLYYQATAIYLGNEKMNVDNEDSTPGKGTAMEHHWDESFGYWGVPKDFPKNTDGLYFWGAYTNGRSKHLGISQPLMDSYIRGRAAISAGDMVTRDEARNNIKTLWEKVVAASAIHYMNGSYEDFDDMGARLHQLSEGVGFIFSLLFNDHRSVNQDEVFDLIKKLGGSEEINEVNLYETSPETILEVRDWLAERFEMEDKKAEL